MTTAERLKHLREIAQGVEILFVEDSDNVRAGTLNILKTFFHSITTAGDGVAGLDVYKYKIEEEHKYFDIVITDVKMPRMNGLDMITEIKKINPDQSCVVLSACEDTPTMTVARDIGVDEYIVKPLELESIINSFTAIIEKQQDGE